MNILEAIKGRASCRAFLAKPVDREIIHAILEAARFAPSGTNTQPWQVAVVTEGALQRVSAAILQAHQQQTMNPDYQYYPREWFDPYKSRRFACGMALYGALNIQRDDKLRRQQVWELNYQFFGAPVGLFIFIDKRLATGSFMDTGMFIQTIMLAAREFGLETCPQAALAEYPDVVRQQLQLDDNTIILCGMALGYPDRAHAINQYRTQREEVDHFTLWYSE
ncbi:MAG: nitroreductase [Legionellales bacterium]|nr:nitroreductase [Legionellales bacterium]